MKSTPSEPRRSRALLAPSVVFLIAFAVRAAAPEAIIFGTDQARDITRGRTVLAGAFPTAGPMIGGVPKVNLGPLYFYAVAAGLAPRDAPRDVLVWLAVLNAAGVAGLAWVVRRGFGARAGIGVGLVLALYPLAILNARAIWNPVITLPTLALFIAGLQRWIADRRPGGLGLALVGAALMVQTHVSTWFLLPLLLLGLFARAPIRGRGCLIGAAVAAALTLPWLVPQIGRIAADPGVLEAAFRRVNEPSSPAAPTIGLLAKLGWMALPELHLGHLVTHGGTVWRAILDLTAFVLGAFAVIGVLRLMTRRSVAPGMRAAWLGALLLPSVAIALMPSAFLHHLAAIVPFRVVLIVLGVTGFAGRPARLAAGAALAAVLGLGVTHLAIDVHHAHRSEVLLRDPDYVNFFRAKSSQPTSMAFPTMRAIRRVGRVLAVDLGAAPHSLLERGRGPWWIAFISDRGFWLREASGDRNPATRVADDGVSHAVAHDATSPVLIRHRSDPYPSPALAQRIAGRRVGAFEAFALESVIDRKTLSFHFPDHNAPGRWVPCSGASSGRVLPHAPCREAWFRLELNIPDPAPAAIVFAVQTPTRRAWKSVHVDGQSLRSAGRKDYARIGLIQSYRWNAPTPGQHFLELRSARKTEPGLTLTLDLIDIWTEKAEPLNQTR